MRSCITTWVWHVFSKPLEGRLYSMYLDIKGLVTTGVGNLIDTVAEAQALPWLHANGSPATPEEVSIAWHALKARQDLAHKSAKEAAKLNDLRLTDDAIDAIVAKRLAGNDAYLRGVFHEWDSWPADAQLAALSMAWAVGAGWPAKFPNCKALLNGREFAIVGKTIGGVDAGVVVANTPSGMRVSGSSVCDINPLGNPGVIPRNALNRLHYIAAGSELAKQFPNVLHGPCSVDAIRSGWVMATDPTQETIS